MALSAYDISMVLSGGSNNIDPRLSIGGLPSATQIVSGNINNLFEDITPGESEAGKIDYRVFYIANDGNENAYNASVWISGDITGGSTIEIGIDKRDESQRVTVQGSATPSGNMVLSIDGKQFTVHVPTPFNLNLWRDNFQFALNSLLADDGTLLYPSVIVLVSASTNSFSFDVNFPLLNGSKNEEQIIEVANNMPGTTIGIITVVNGSPINTIATQLDSELNTPAGVSFGIPTEASPIFFYVLRPSDFFALWVKRTTLAGVDSLANDGVTLSFRSETFANPTFLP